MLEKDFFLISHNINTNEIFKKLKNESKTISAKSKTISEYLPNFEYFLNDIFAALFQENYVSKVITEVSPKIWQNLILIEGILSCYQYENIYLITKNNANEAFYTIEIITDELLKLITNKKKMAEILKESKDFFAKLEEKNYDFEKINIKLSSSAPKNDISEQKKAHQNLTNFKKELKTIIRACIEETNKAFVKTIPLMELLRGHSLDPLFLQNISLEDKLILADKLNKPKTKELIKTYIKSELSSAPKSNEQPKEQTKGHINKSLNLDLDIPVKGINEIIYLNSDEEGEQEKYKKLLIEELENYKTNTKQSPFTVYVKNGNAESRDEVLESLAITFNVVELARLEKRNCIVIISAENKEEKTYTFTNKEVLIDTNNNSTKHSCIEGIISLANDLISGNAPVKKKSLFSLNLNLKGTPGKKKFFKKKPTLIRFT